MGFAKVMSSLLNWRLFLFVFLSLFKENVLRFFNLFLLFLTYKITLNLKEPQNNSFLSETLKKD